MKSLQALFFFFEEWKCFETKLAGECCWAITQAAGRSYCGRSGSIVLGFGSQVDPVVCRYVFDHMRTELRLVQRVTVVGPSVSEQFRKSECVCVQEHTLQCNWPVMFSVQDSLLDDGCGWLFRYLVTILRLHVLCRVECKEYCGNCWYLQAFKGNRPWHMLKYCPIIWPEGQMRYAVLIQSVRGKARHWYPGTFACEVVRRITSARPEV